MKLEMELKGLPITTTNTEPQMYELSEFCGVNKVTEPSHGNKIIENMGHATRRQGTRLQTCLRRFLFRILFKTTAQGENK